MILFTADWHIKLGQKNVPVSWAKQRYFDFFRQVQKYDSVCDLHIIGGDLFDRLPSMEELELYFHFITGVKIKTIIYDGNHEATKKHKTFFSNLSEITNRINPLVTVVTETFTDTDIGFTILPYADLHRKGSIEALDNTIPLFTHVRGEIPPHVKPEVDLERFKDFPVVFAGDLHSHSNTQKNIVYPGSPLTTSFHRNEVKTGCLLIEADWSWEWQEFYLPQLIRKTVTDPADMLPTAWHHTIYEIEGDIQDLANIEDSSLLDKKVVKRNTETSLVMDKDMTIVEELAEYLNYILEIEERKIPQIIGTYNDYASKAQLE